MRLYVILLGLHLNKVPLFVASYFGEWLEYLMEWFTRFHYLGPFIVLLLCGLGAPLPEEITLIGCGYLVHLKVVGFVPITLVCSAAILIGDSIPYWLGRRYGLAALKTRWVAKVLHPERFAKIERRFEENKNWSIFTCRFLPGLRIPGYFVAGTLRMSYTRFLILDSLGVLLSVPSSIWVASIVFRGIQGDEGFEGAGGAVSKLNHYLLFGVGAVVLGILVFGWLRKRAKAKTLSEAPPEAIEALIDSRRYADAVNLVGDLDAHIGTLVADTEVDVHEIETKQGFGAEAAVEARRCKLSRDLSGLYEALLGAARIEDADRLAQSAVGLHGKASTYLAFLRAAARAEAHGAAGAIAAKAEEDLRLDEAEKAEIRSVARAQMQPG